MLKPIIPILNGPNLNLLGVREPEIYGNTSFEEFIWNIREEFNSVYIPYHQSNHEGEVIDLIQKYGYESKGLVINPGGLTHTSISIMDAIKAISCPVVEVHISKVSERESYRRNSFIKSVCTHSIEGKGLAGYYEAIKLLINF